MDFYVIFNFQVQRENKLLDVAMVNLPLRFHSPALQDISLRDISQKYLSTIVNKNALLGVHMHTSLMWLN